MKLGKVGLILAARTQSRRLPGKALLPLQQLPMIVFLLRRLRKLHCATVMLATTTLPSDERMAAIAHSEGVAVFRGAVADVVERYVTAAAEAGFDTVVRVTGDCPFIDASMVDWCLEQAEASMPFDLATTKGVFPVGLDVEIYPTSVMKELHQAGVLSDSHREHLTLYLYEHSDRYAVKTLAMPAGWPSTTKIFTVDTAEDYQLASQRAARFNSPYFSVADLLKVA